MRTERTIRILDLTLLGLSNDSLRFCLRSHSSRVGLVFLSLLILVFPASLQAFFHYFYVHGLRNLFVYFVFSHFFGHVLVKTVQNLGTLLSDVVQLAVKLNFEGPKCHRPDLVNFLFKLLLRVLLKFLESLLSWHIFIYVHSFLFLSLKGIDFIHALLGSRLHLFIQHIGDALMDILLLLQDNVLVPHLPLEVLPLVRVIAQLLDPLLLVFLHQF